MVNSRNKLLKEKHSDKISLALPLQIGDLVLADNVFPKPTKLKISFKKISRRLGPYIIKDIIEPVTYICECLEDGKIRHFHRNDLNKYSPFSGRKAIMLKEADCGLPRKKVIPLW